MYKISESKQAMAGFNQKRKRKNMSDEKEIMEMGVLIMMVRMIVNVIDIM